MTVEVLKIAEIKFDVAEAVRAKLDENTVKDYRDKIQLGTDFPAIIVYRDGHGVNWAADGRHTAAAHERAGLTEIRADVRQGTRSEAVVFAAGSNDAHGLKRSNADKASAVKALLTLSEWNAKSNNAVAEACRVSSDFVSSIRASMTPTVDADSSPKEPTKRVGKDGKVRTVKPKKPKDRQPGDDTQAEADEKARPRNGQPLFDGKEFDAAYGALYRQVDKLGNAYRAKETPPAEGLRRTLKEWKDQFAAWKKELKAKKE